MTGLGGQVERGLRVRLFRLVNVLVRVLFGLFRVTLRLTPFLVRLLMLWRLTWLGWLRGSVLLRLAVWSLMFSVAFRRRGSDYLYWRVAVDRLWSQSGLACRRL